VTSDPNSKTNKIEQRNRPPPKPLIVRIFRTFKRQYHHAKRYGKKGETEHQRNERMMAKWTLRLGIFTIVLAFVAAVTAGILYRTDQTLRETLSVNRLDQRAWLAPSRAAIESGTVSVYFGNVGKSPTLRAQIVIKEIIAGHGTAAIYSDIENQVKGFCPVMPTKERLTASEVAFIVAPNEAISSFFPSAPDAYVRNVGVKETGFVVGCMSYETAGETHHTAFCYMHSGTYIRRCSGHPEAGYFANYAD
jgi:hypothetical protein